MANEYEKTVQQGKRGKPDIVYYVEKGGSGKTISPEEYEQTKKLGEINKNLKAQDGHATDMAKLIESQTNLLNSISNSLGQQTSIAEQQAVDDKTTSAAEGEDEKKGKSTTKGYFAKLTGAVVKLGDDQWKRAKTLAKGGIAAFFTAAGLYALYQFLESPMWKELKTWIAKQDWAGFGTMVKAIWSGISSAVSAIYCYFLDPKTGLVSRISTVINTFKTEGIMAGLKSIGACFGWLDIAVIGIGAVLVGLVGMKALGALGIIFAVKLIGKSIGKLWTAMKGILKWTGLIGTDAGKVAAKAKKAASPTAKKTLKTATQANPELGKATLNNKGEVVRQYTGKLDAKGNPITNPKYNMIENIAKNPVIKKPPSKTAQAVVAMRKKLAAQMLAKGAGKSFLKKLPLLGLGAASIFAIQRLMEGDMTGASMEMASGGMSMLPGAGTAGSMGMDVAIIMRDLKRTQNMLPNLQKDQAGLQKKMAERAKFREMFGITESNMFDRNKKVAYTDHRGNPILGRDGKPRMVNDTYQNWAKRTFGNQRLTEEQAALASKFLPGKVVKGESMSSVARSRGRDFFISQKDTFRSLNESSAQLAEFIKTITDYNESLKQMRLEKEQAAQAGGNSPTIINQDNSQTQTGSDRNQLPPVRANQGMSPGHPAYQGSSR